MTSIYLQDFVRDLLDYHAKGNFTAIAKEFLPIVNTKFIVHMDETSEESLEIFFKSTLPLPWSTVLLHHIKARTRASKDKISEAFDCQEQALIEYIRYLIDANREQLPILYALIQDLKLLAILADKKSATVDNKPASLERSTQTITRAFSACLNDRQNQAVSFIWGVYGVANELFCIYLKLKKLNLYKSIIRSLEVGGLPPIEEFPISQQITFHYYLGRYEFFNEDFAESKVHLNSAFKMCPTQYSPQRRQILSYLLPVMLQTGRLPKPKLLNQFPTLSAIYRPIVNAIHQGYLLGLEKAIGANERYLLDKGVYLILEKTKDLACRELLRNTNKVVGAEARLDMSKVHLAFNLSSEKEMDYDQVECQVAVLIYKRLVMGYISHDKGILVLSKMDPFPFIGGIQT